MSSIAGIGRPGGAPVAPGDIEAMLDALDHWGAEARGRWMGEGAGLGHLLLRTTPQSLHESLPAHDGECGLAITGDLRLDNRTELAGRLGIPASDLDTWSDGRLVLAAYREWGESCPAHLLGDFAFAVWDGRRQHVFCARDHFGVKPFYYSQGDGTLAFASEVKALLALPFVDRTLDETWIADYLHRVAVDRVGTLYARIRRLEPAHALTFGVAGMRIRRYWELNPLRASAPARDDEYIDAFRETLALAIRRRVQTPYEVGAELSGGLDSSGICAIAHSVLRDRGRTLQTFAQVRPDSGDDVESLPEDARWAIDLLCEHTGITETRLLTGEGGIVHALAWAGRHYDEPPRNIVSLYNDQLYDAAAAGQVRVLLSGFGGNQGVSARGDDRDRELLYGGRLIELWRELSARAGQRHPVLGFLLLLLREGHGPGWDALLKRTSLWKRYPYRLTRDTFARRIGMRRRTLRYARQYDLRMPLEEQPAAALALPTVPLRLEYAHLATAARRLEYRYPLLDVELVSLYAGAPSHLKHWRGTDRYLFRRSLEGWVPDAVRWASGNRASANPGNLRRKRRDHDELRSRLHGLPADHPLFTYVDTAKLSPDAQRRGRFRRERDRELLMALLLAQTLASDPPRVSRGPQ